MADDQFTLADPEGMMDASVRLKGYIGEIASKLEDMRRWMAVAETLWSGAAADAYVSRFRELALAIDHDINECTDMAKTLERHAIQHGAVEREAQSIALETGEIVARLVEKADWADIMA